MNETAHPSSSPTFPAAPRLGLFGIVFAIGLALGFGCGAFYWSSFGPSAAAGKGAFFCCDEAGKPCVHSPDGDCKVPLRWCPETKRLDDGTVVCVSE